MNELIKFLETHTRNSWISIGVYSVYVRRAYHIANGKLLNTFDIANIETAEKNRGKGGFKLLLSDIQRLLESSQYLRGEIEAIYIESVLNRSLAQTLPILGFELVEGSTPPSFVKLLNI